MKKLLRALRRLFLTLLILVLVAAVGLIAFLSAKEYRPADREPLDVIGGNAFAERLSVGESVELLSWNIGYAGLGAESDFFMDGGKSARSADKMQVSAYLGGIFDTLYNKELEPDLILLQEVDVDSSRSYGIDETELLGRDKAFFAYNYACPFVPVPMPPMGKVYSGLLTNTAYEVEQAERIALPCPFSWPMSTVNLKRCLLVSYLPLNGTDKKLVLVNLHLEAYDDGEGKAAQTKVLNDFLQAEYDKGNYVIAGGDFNQSFPGALERYPILRSDLWTPGTLTEDILPEGWRFAYDLSAPSCRLLNQPYDPADAANTQHYVIDGFILSPNVTLEEIETLDLGFADSDHNPVRLCVKLAG